MQQPQYQHHTPPALTSGGSSSGGWSQSQSQSQSQHELGSAPALASSASSPAMPALSHSGSAEPQRPSQRTQSSSPSSSAAAPPASLLTTSSSSPLSSSSSSSSSSTERWVRECLIKCLQIVLHSRLLSPASDSHLPVNKTFNLHTPEAGITHAEWDERMRGKEGQVIVLDVLLSSSSSSASPVLLERWSLHHDVDDLFASAPLSASSSSRRVDPSLMFKRMLLLCRSLYSYVRLLPAASLAKQAHTYVEHDYSPPFTLHYSLHTSSHASAAAFIAAPASYSFSPIITPRGSFNLHVLYLPDLSFFSFPPVKRAMASELMEDYMTRVHSSPAAAVELRGGRRQSMPVVPSSAAFPLRAATVSALPSSSSAAPSSLPASLSGRALVDRFSPVTNTPPFTHGSPPTPSHYPPSLSDTPPFLLAAAVAARVRPARADVPLALLACRHRASAASCSAVTIPRLRLRLLSSHRHPRSALALVVAVIALPGIALAHPQCGGSRARCQPVVFAVRCRSAHHWALAAFTAQCRLRHPAASVVLLAPVATSQSRCPARPAAELDARAASSAVCHRRGRHSSRSGRTRGSGQRGHWRRQRRECGRYAARAGAAAAPQL